MSKPSMKDQLAQKFPEVAAAVAAEGPVPPPVGAPADTSQFPPIVHLVGSMGHPPGKAGFTDYIEKMEAGGQRQLVASATLPTQLNGCTEVQLRALGIELGPVPTTGDTLFRSAKLPEGWKLVPSGHSMWSNLIDARGFSRASIFYKAAFYDRNAHMSLDIRLHIREDYDSRDRDGTVAFDVRATMPGERSQDGDWPSKVIHRYEHPTKVLTKGKADKMTSTEAQAFYAVVDEARAVVDAWVAEAYPDRRDPLAYWDCEF